MHRPTHGPTKDRHRARARGVWHGRALQLTHVRRRDGRYQEPREARVHETTHHGLFVHHGPMSTHVAPCGALAASLVPRSPHSTHHGPRPALLHRGRVPAACAPYLYKVGCDARRCVTELECSATPQRSATPEHPPAACRRALRTRHAWAGGLVQVPSVKLVVEGEEVAVGVERLQRAHQLGQRIGGGVDKGP